MHGKRPRARKLILRGLILLNFSNEFWVQIVIYALSFGTVYGSFRTKLNYLEKKMDKYNNMQERMIMAEQSVKSAHHRIDEINQRREVSA
jgi:hypothetical protein